MISESDSSRHLEQTNCAAGVSAAAMKYDFIIVVVMVSRAGCGGPPQHTHYQMEIIENIFMELEYH